MTIEELKIIITADNSDVSKKLKILNNIINNFQNKTNSAFVPDTKLLEKSSNELKKILNSLSATQKQNAEKNSLTFKQMEEKKNLSLQLAGNKYFKQSEKIEARYRVSVEHWAEKNALRRNQLNENSFLKQQAMLEKQSQQEIKITENLRQRKQDMYEKMFVQQRESEKKNALKHQQMLEKQAQKEIQIAEKISQKKQQIAERTIIKQRKEEQKKSNSSLLNKAVGSFAIGKLIGIGALASAGIEVARATTESVKNGIKDALKSIDTESMFQLSLGKQADEVRKWSEEISNSLGLNELEVRKNTASTYHMIRSMHIAKDTAKEMAKGLELLSKDVASFQGKDPEQTAEKIRSALMGQTRGVHLLGYAITEANVKQYAWTHGIAESGKQLNEQQKVVARYLLLMEQTRQTHGKLASTLNSASAQTAILKAQQESLSRSWGELFIPMLNSILPRLIAFTKIMKVLVEEVKAFFGIKSSTEIAKELTKNQTISMSINEELEDSGDNANQLAKNLKKATKEAKAQLATFDEMNVIDKKKAVSPKTNNANMPNYGGKFSFPVDDYTQEIQKAIENSDNKANTIFEKWKTNREKNTERIKKIQEHAKEQWNDPLIDIRNLESVKRAVKRISNLEIPKWDQDLKNSNEAVKKFEEERKKILKESLHPKGLAGNPIGLTNTKELNGFEKILKQKKEEISNWLEKMPYEFQDALTKSSNAIEKWLSETGSKIYTWFSETGEKTKAWFNTKKEEFKTWSNETGEKIGEGFKQVSSKLSEKGAEIKTWLDTKKSEIATWSKESSESVGKFFSELPSKISAWFGETGSKIYTWFAIKKQELTTWASEMAEKIGRFFSNIPNAIFNSITSTFEKIRKWISDKLGDLISFISGGSGGNKSNSNYYADPISRLGLPKFATGGIVDKPTYAQIGESGAEAVVPLENTKWIDILVSKINGNNSQPINLTVKIGEDSIINRVIDGINNKTMEMGRGMVMM